MPRMDRRVVAIVIPGLIAAGLGASVARGRPGASVPAQSAARARGERLPDSVLARIGARREVTLSRFLADWTQLKPPQRPDSLTPQTAREFLQLLIGKEALGEKALAERRAWAADDSAEYQALRDHLVLGAALDSALDATRARLGAASGGAPGRGALGVIARDSLVAGLGVRFDEALLERLARAFAALPRPSRDSSLYAQLRQLGAMPEFADSLLPRPLAEGSGVRYTVADLLDAWRHTDPFARPRVATAAQVRDLVANGIFERALRREGERRRLADRPDIAGTLAERREYFAVKQVVAREVYAKIAADSLTLERYYRAHLDQWSLPLRVRLTRMVLADRASATRMRLRLANAADAESLAELGVRSGAQYRVVVSAESDSELFARSLAAGAGAVIGPDSVRGGWAVARVTEIVPGRGRSFSEARQLVHHAWYGEEGERLMRALLDRVRSQTRVTINQRALGALRAAPP